MKPSIDRIRTTHTGSLPRPADMLAALHARFEGGSVDEAAYEKALARNVREIVRKQVEAGIDIVSDGECSKPSFMAYRAERIGGFEPRVPKGGMPAPGPVDPNGRDATLFPEYYRNMLAASPVANTYYKSEAEYFHAHGEAMREEYRAILDAGLDLQIDDPRMVSSWDSRKDMDLAQYRAWMQKRIEFLNHALRGLPEERIRYHTCYGVNFGPRLSDLQLGQVLDLILTIRAGACSFEAANPRHDHEWRVAQRLKLPEGKMLIPGAVTHSNVTIEHPEGGADRIERWARAAGRENVMFGNDCGFASTAGNTEIPEAVAWAKLKALGDGARIASRRLR